MATADGISPKIRARIIHAALVLGILMFGAVAFAIRDRSIPSEALPDRRVLYVALALVSATLFGAAAFMTGRLRVGGDVQVLLDRQPALAEVDDIFALVRADTTYD